ncbi:MAG TPA: endonuclease MutS2 [Limnochordia bacterium]|nr:endonuclease MutS2 [Limnochordia bacterium]
MDQRSLRVLEWDKIKHQVAQFASFSLGKQLALELQPSSVPDEVKARQELTTQSVAMLWKQGTPPFGGATDVTSILQRAAVGGILDGQELLKLAGVLDCAGNMRRYLGEVEVFQRFRDQLAYLPELAAEINRCLDDEGQVKDSASPKLKAVRQKIRSLEARVREKLNSIIHSNSNQKLLQESIVTIRNGRYVVPVRQEHRSVFGGIVHDQSASGATVFVEPQAVVDLNNELRIALQDEQREIERILSELSSMAAPYAEQLRQTLDALARLDLVFAMGKYSRQTRSTAARINQEGKVLIKQGRHPLLTVEVVPIDFWLEGQAYILVITGPNTGGKTVTLKTVGLFAIMNQAGLHIPADEGSEMPVFDNIFADIGDEQSIEQSLSTFSSHMSYIVKILDQSTSQSLVLLDELGAGTDPTEGAALAMAILDYLRREQVTAVATTHYSELKHFAYAHPEVENASVEFDPVTLKPTYRLAIGIPGKSNAFAIAKGLGLKEELVGHARSLLSEQKIKVEDIIGEIEINQRQARQARDEAEALRNEYEQLKHKYEQLYQQLRDTREGLIARAHQEAEELVKKTRQELDLLIGELRKQQNVDLENMAKAKREELLGKERQFAAGKPQLSSTAPLHNLKPGEHVKVRSLNQTGYVLEVTGNEAQVQVGILKVGAKLNDLERVAPEPKTPIVHRVRGRSMGKSISIKPEIDLRGYTVDDAEAAVDKYLDDAVLSSITQVRIIHGKGTGTLREAIQNQLSSHPYVKSFRLADPNQGGSGVTIVELAD